MTILNRNTCQPHRDNRGAQMKNSMNLKNNVKNKIYNLGLIEYLFLCLLH